jgi:hypothetical protein
MSPYESVLDELEATLRGPRRSRQRLLDEIRDDLKDAIRFERTAGLTAEAAEARVAARFGSPAAIASRWNSDQALRRQAARRNILMLMIAIATAGALGITQYASGKNSPMPRGCPKADWVAAAEQTSADCSNGRAAHVGDRPGRPGPRLAGPLRR